MKRKTPPEIINLMVAHFESLEDPRLARTRHHPLINILVMALCGSICGADGWEALEAFAEARSDWFSTFLEMPHGAPSADTFRRVLSALDPLRFEELFRRWMEIFTRSLKGEVVALDGKSMRGAIDRASTTTPLHLLHAFATEQQLVLAQRAVDGAPGEVKAMSEILRLLDLQGAIVTADANGCSAEVTKSAREAGAHFILTLKGNRGHLHKHVVSTFDVVEQHRFRGVRTHRTSETGHGRKESRTVRAVPLKTWPSKNPAWTDVNTAVLVDRTRTVNDKETTERHYYITNLPPDPKKIGTAIRSHWGIENRLHWLMDVAFDEDRWRIRNVNGAQNFALIARFALMLLKRESSAGYGVPTKMKKAGWDNDYLVCVLAAGMVED